MSLILPDIHLSLVELKKVVHLKGSAKAKSKFIIKGLPT